MLGMLTPEFSPRGEKYHASQDIADVALAICFCFV
jgi:hypothetical protein